MTDSANKDQKNRIFDTMVMTVISVAVGAVTSLLGLGFKALIDLVHTLFFKGPEYLLGSLTQHFYVLLLPALGGLAVGPITHFLAKETKGHGVPEVIATVTAGNGEIRSRVVIVKALSSALTIGSGGSAGSEGPIVHIGAGVGSVFGRLVRRTGVQLKTIVCCGSAAGIASVFNAPIAGVFFAVEVISGNISAKLLSYTVLASVTASSLARSVFWGNHTVFQTIQYSPVNAQEMIFYAILGVLAGSFAVIAIKTASYVEDIFEKWKKVPLCLKPALGGLMVGVIGLFLPQVFGIGYETINLALTQSLSLMLLIALTFMKLLAVSLTLGSGGSGGILVPSLFMGATLGGAFGQIAHTLVPMISVSPEAYSLAGMGAVFSGVIRAPMTSIILLLEITGNFQMILPIMLACITSFVVATFFHPESIYTLKLARQGILFEFGNRELFKQRKVS